jgi:hypothetical protein
VEAKINYFSGALASITNDPCRHTGADRHRRQICCHNCSRPDHGAITDRDARRYHRVGSEPYIIADPDWRILSGLIANQFTTGYSMIRGEDRYAGAEQHVVSDRDWARGRGPDGAKMIDKGMVTDLDHLRVLEDHCRGDFHSFAQPFQLCLAQIAAAGDKGQQVEPTSQCLCDRSDQPAPFGVHLAGGRVDSLHDAAMRSLKGTA